MSRKKHTSNSKRSREKARQARREAREVREMLKMPVDSRRGVNRRAAENRRRFRRGLLWLTGLTALAVAGWALFHKAFYDNPEFLLKHVEVLNDGTLTKQEILQTAQIPSKINLLEIDLKAIDTNLRSRSQVRDVRVKRKVPDTLEIMVWERTPVAWLGYQGGDLDKRQEGILLDAEGIAICCHTLYREFYDFPVILIPREMIEEFVIYGEKVDLPSVEAALELVHLWPMEPHLHPNLHLAQIDASRHYRLTVDCLPETQLVFLPENLRGQLIKLGDTIRHGERQNRYFAKVDLTVADNIPVIYHDANFAPALEAPADAIEQQPAPRWQPRSPWNHQLSEQDLENIVNIDS